MTQTITESKVYLNSWHFYNEGYLGFGWMTTEEARTFIEEHENDTRYEELFIADYESDYKIKNCDYCNVFEELDNLDAFDSLEDFDRDCVSALLENGYTLPEAIDSLDNFIFYADIDEYHDFCDELIECHLSGRDDIISRYFDYEAYHRDCDYDITEASNGICYLN